MLISDQGDDTIFGGPGGNSHLDAGQGRAREPQRAAVDLTRAFSTRGQVVHRRLLNRRHDQHVRENAPVERERASGSGRR
jgi:hypothetical protein